MEDHPGQLNLDFLSQVQGIFSDPVDTNVDFPRYLAVCLRQIESDYIGIVVMAQVLAIDLQKLPVRAKHVIQTAEFPFFQGEDRLDMPFQPGSVSKGRNRFIKKEINF